MHDTHSVPIKIAFGLKLLLAYIVYESYNKNINNRQCTYNVTISRVRATIVAVQEQKVLHILSVCL